MPIKLNTASGGGVILQGANTASDKTITIPADDGTMIYSNSSGNVGIGTSSPLSTAMLEVSRSTTVIPTATVTADNQVTGWRVRRTGGTYPREWYLGIRENSTALDIYDNTADALRARIDSSGNLLVGQTAQTGSERFGVTQSSTSASSARFYASSTSYANDIVQISCARSGATTEYNALTVFDNNTTLKMLIRANGNLLNANNSYGSLSDERVKENIVDATPKLEKINQVRVVNFNMIGDTQKQIGVIAQELEQIFPSMIEEDAEGMKGVKYSVFVPMLIKAIQELKAEVDSLRAQVEAK